MAFCANCGSPGTGRFCSRCGTPVGYVQPAAGGPATGENILAALCYIPMVGLALLVAGPYTRNREIRFKALQSLFWATSWILAGTVLIVAGVDVSRESPTHDLIMLAVLIGAVPMAFRAYRRDRFHMPVIGRLAEAMS